LALRNWRFASPKTIKRLLVTEVEDLRVTSISRCVRFHVKRSSSPCAPTAQDTKQFAHCSGIKLQFQLQTKSAYCIFIPQFSWPIASHTQMDWWALAHQMAAWTQDFYQRCTGFKTSSSTTYNFFVNPSWLSMITSCWIHDSTKT
jgi:hypothetical protein